MTDRHRAHGGAEASSVYGLGSDQIAPAPVLEDDHAPRGMVFAAVLVTGAVTLALELITSRALTPYVGGGLIVWTAILSITLLALAAGYHFGSRWSRQARRRFVLVPAAAAAILALTAVSYPLVLPPLTAGHALVGAFLGAGLMLAPTLVLLSAMGPLGIALIKRGPGDSGAGKVFAVSTVGSVLGVFLASFALLPFLSPPMTLAMLAAALALVAVGTAWRLRAAAGLLPLLPAALVAGALGTETLGAPPEGVRMGSHWFAHIATERSPQATIVVVDVTHPGHDGRVRLYLEENQAQSALGFGVPGQPMGYVAIAEALIRDRVEPGGRVLAVGLAGGVAASALARAGYAVDAVEINPAAVAVARDRFDLDPSIHVMIGDARRAIGTCRGPYDAVFLDVFDGLHTPEHLVTQEFFEVVDACLAPQGVIVVNAIIPALDTRPSRRLLAALVAARAAPVAVYEDPPADRGRNNRVLLIQAPGVEAPTLSIPDFPTRLLERAPLRLAPEVVTADDLAGVAPLTDGSNDFALSLALTSGAPPGIPIPAQWY